MAVAEGGAIALESWRLVRRMLDDLTESIESEAETELELLEGIRVLGRATALCSELSLDVDADAPWFFSMNTEARLIGGPNPDGEYFLAMIDGGHRYRVRGLRGTTAYLGFQVLAGVGLTPRRMGAYVSDRDLRFAGDGSFAFVLAAAEPSAEGAGGRPVGGDPRGLLGDRGARVHLGSRDRGRGRARDRAAGSAGRSCTTHRRVTR